MVSHRKTDFGTEHRVLSLIAVGVKYTEISQRTGVAVSTIKKIKKRNSTQLVQVRYRVIEWQTNEVKKILQRSYSLIHQKLDQAERGQLDISIRDLLAINKEMFKQTELEKINPDHSNPPISPELLALAAKL